MSSSTQQSSAQNRPAFTTQALVTMAIFAAILCISAYISIPLPLPGSPHITLLNFVILLIALLFPLQQSFLIVLVWMLLGCVSLPVFIGGGAGIGYLTGPWGGYTFSFRSWHCCCRRSAVPVITGSVILSSPSSEHCW